MSGDVACPHETFPGSCRLDQFNTMNWSRNTYPRQYDCYGTGNVNDRDLEQGHTSVHKGPGNV